jgi:hypothetical protein
VADAGEKQRKGNGERARKPQLRRKSRYPPLQGGGGGLVTLEHSSLQQRTRGGGGEEMLTLKLKKRSTLSPPSPTSVIRRDGGEAPLVGGLVELLPHEVLLRCLSYLSPPELLCCQVPPSPSPLRVSLGRRVNRWWRRAEGEPGAAGGGEGP